MRPDEKVWKKAVPAPTGAHGERVRFEEGTLIGRTMAVMSEPPPTIEVAGRTMASTPAMRRIEILAEDRLGRITGAAFERELGACTIEPHRLKTHPKQFAAVADGSKRFEVRSTEDRQFWSGDLLLLEEWNPDDEEYSGRWHLARVTYVLTGGNYGLPHETAVLSIEDAEPCIGDVFRLAYPDADGRRISAREHTVYVVENTDYVSDPVTVQLREYIPAPWGPSWWPLRELARKVARRA